MLYEKEKRLKNDEKKVKKIPRRTREKTTHKRIKKD